MQMRFKKAAAIPLVGAAVLLGGTVAMAAGPMFHEVHPKSFDPAHTFLVDSDWSQGLGCPTSTDPGCSTGDSKDKQNQGLILAKTGPTTTNAAGVAELKDVKGTQLTELGYDIRKPGTDVNDPRGSHCGNGAPRFDIAMQDGTSYFLGCNSPAPTSDTAGGAFQRLRWGDPNTNEVMAFGPNGLENIGSGSGKTVQSIFVVFDEGTDTAPDNFGVAILDNIDVNGVLVGQGPHGDH